MGSLCFMEMTIDVNNGAILEEKCDDRKWKCRADVFIAAMRRKLIPAKELFVSKLLILHTPHYVTLHTTQTSASVSLSRSLSVSLSVSLDPPARLSRLPVVQTNVSYVGRSRNALSPLESGEKGFRAFKGSRRRDHEERIVRKGCRVGPTAVQAGFCCCSALANAGTANLSLAGSLRRSGRVRPT